MCACVQCRIYSVTSSSSFFVSSSIRRMSSIVRSIHLSIEQKSCLWKFANKRSSIWTDRAGEWDRDTEGEQRLNNNYNNKRKKIFWGTCLVLCGISNKSKVIYINAEIHILATRIQSKIFSSCSKKMYVIHLVSFFPLCPVVRTTWIPQWPTYRHTCVDSWPCWGVLSAST